jgi:arylsulfatase A-like enzyme
MNPQRPNILLITTDQQRTDSLSCYGSRCTDTPHLDQLASEGVCLERAYCANPVCTPARATIFTGRHLSRHGAWNVGMNVPADEPMISHRLGAVGYRTHYIGKAHFQPFGGSQNQSVEGRNGNTRYPDFRGPYYGFETIELALGHTTYGIAGHYGEWVRSQVSTEEFDAYQKATCLAENRFGGEAYDWEIPLKYHNSVWTANRTVDFLETHSDENPFLLAIGFEDPHHPHCLPTEFDDRVSPDDVPLPDFVDGELDDKPPHFLEARHGQLEDSDIRGQFPIAGQGGGFDYRKVTEKDARLGRAYYFSMIKLIDQQVGRILECLERNGLAENTLVCFTSDHGELLGDHGLWMKGPFHYEQLIRIPMLMRWPQGFSGGKQLSALFSHVDIVPTILAAVGLPIPAEVDGVNALPLLRGETENVRESALIECVDDPNGLRLKTVVTRNRKLTWYCGKDYGELYDLDKDPREQINRWEHPDYATDRARLLARLLDTTEVLEKRAHRISYA